MVTIDQAEVMLNLWLLEQAWQPNKVQAPVLCCPGPDEVDARQRFIDIINSRAAKAGKKITEITV